MNKRILFFLIPALIITAHSYARQPAQSKCNLTETSAPKIYGVGLGMSTQQVLAAFPGSAENRDIKRSLEGAKAHGANETAYLSFEPANHGGKEDLAQVDTVSVVLSKGRVVEFSVTYLGATWSRIDDWVAKASESFGLPGAQEWTVGPSENPNKVLRCSGIDIEAAIAGGSASIRIRNAEHFKQLDARARDEEERRRREFKPK